MKARSMIVVGVVLVSITAILLGKETVSYLSGARGYAAGQLRERIPTGVEIARLRTMLDSLDRMIAKRREVLVELQLQAEGLENEVLERARRLGEDEIVHVNREQLSCA